MGLSQLYTRMRCFLQTYKSDGGVLKDIIDATEELKLPTLMHTYDVQTYKVEGENYPRMKVMFVVGFE